MATKWGIASAGKISHDFVTALSILPAEEHIVVAVAASDIDRAQIFANLHSIKSFYGSYKELARDDEVDVVYIGAVNSQHFHIGKLMLENGKSVLCEKPLTLNQKQTWELIKLAREKNLFLMEGVWSRCFPAYEMLKKELEMGSIGDIVQVIVNLGAPLDNLDRLKLKELGGGSILDLGVYCLQFILFAFGAQRPQNVVALGQLNDHAVDKNMGCVFMFERGKTAIASIHTQVKLPNEGIIVGTKGIVRVPEPFWCPTKVIMPCKISEFILPASSKQFNYTNSIGLCYEALEVRRCLKRGLVESPRITHEESLLLAEMEDKLRFLLGVKYQQEES